MTGIEVDETRIKFCNLLAEENPNLKIKFLRARIEEFVPEIQPGEYDLILGLNVFHHLSKLFGWKIVQQLLSVLSKKIEVGIFEFATESFWWQYVPKDYRDYVTDFSFVRVLSYHAHADASEFKWPRPLCFVSDKYAYFEETGILKINDITYSPFREKKSLKNFHCGDKFVKYFLIDNQWQLDKAQTELNFLQEFGGKKGLPKLHASRVEQDNTGTRFFIVRDKIPGISLLEKIKSGDVFDSADIVKQALNWMVFFEKYGYYHGDIGLGNFIYGDDGKIYPVDYEEIRTAPIVLIWPYKTILLFLNFMNEVFEKTVYERSFSFQRRLKCLTSLKKHIGDKKFSRIMRIKDSEKYFARLYEILFESDDETFDGYTMSELELLAVEDYSEDVGRKLKECENYFGQIISYVNGLNAKIAEQQKRIEELEKRLT